MANSESKYEMVDKIENRAWSSDLMHRLSAYDLIGSGDAFELDRNEPLERLVKKRKIDSSLMFFGSDDAMPSSLNNSSVYALGFDDDSTRNPQFQPSNVFIPERWESNFSLDARVYQLDNSNVYCDCLVDPDEQQFEKRVFPRLLFEHLFELKEGSLVIIKIRSKKGTIRIDVTDGRGIVSPDNFEMESMWDSLKGF